jgi:hypothetical protein
MSHINIKNVPRLTTKTPNIIQATVSTRSIHQFFNTFLIDIDIQLAELGLGLLDLFLERLVLLGHVVKGQDHIAEARAEEAGEDNEGVEW